MMDVEKIANKLRQYVIELRREFHMHPEMPYEEKETSERICRELEANHIEYEIVGKYNVIGKLKFGDGKKIAIRADIDALPIEEKLEVPWKSKNKGVMHACGHDAHTAILLATAKGLLKMKDQLDGSVFVCFQQAEEIGGCADECVEYLQKQGGVDGTIAIHMDPGLNVGEIEVEQGARCSGSEIFYIDIMGNGGHGSRPDLSIDPIQIACDIYQKVKLIPVYNHNPFDTCIVSVCMLQSGNRFNVFPNNAHMEGTVRYFKLGDGEVILNKISQIASTIAENYGAKANVTSCTAAKYPLINEKISVELARQAAKDIGIKNIFLEPCAGSDNFAEFLQAFPGCYCNLGSKSLRSGVSNILHHEKFDLDEESLVKGIAFFLQYVQLFQQ